MHTGLALFILLQKAENRAYVAECVIWYAIELKFDSALGPPLHPALMGFRDIDTLAGYAMEIAGLGE